MRILYVLTDAKIGGAETLLETLALRKCEEDHVGLLVLLGRDQLSPRLERAFDSVEYLDVGEDSRNLLRMVRGMESVVRSFRPDVINSHLFHADLVTILARTPGIPKVTTIHTQGFGPRDHPLTKLIAHAVGVCSFRFDAAIPTGAGSRDFARRLGFRKLLDSIPNSANIPDQPLFDVESKVFCSIGRFHPVKGHAVLLEAFAEFLSVHPDWKLVLAGPGLDQGNDELRQIVDRNGLGSALASGSLILRGSTDDVGSVFKVSSALVISSLYGESFPMVGVEANGAGIPVITTDVGESKIFAFDNSFVVRPGDAAELAAAMSRFAELSPSERQNMSNAVRARALTKFDPRELVSRYRSVYSQLIAARRIRST